jgi:hydrogenase maturation protease
MSTSLVLGLGNTLLSDDGMGIHVLIYLTRYHPDLPGVHYLDGGTLSFTLAEPIQEADNLIVIDAARTGRSPGTVFCLRGTQFDAFLRQARLSAHEVGLSDLIDIARLTESLPLNRALVGIEPLELGCGESPTPALQESIPIAANQVIALLKDWDAVPAAYPTPHPLGAAAV